MALEKEDHDVMDYIQGNEVYSVINRIKLFPNAPLRIVLLTKNYNRGIKDLSDLLNSNGIYCNLKARNDQQVLWELSIQNQEDSEKISCPNCEHEFNLDVVEKFPLRHYIVEFEDSDLMILVSNSKSSFDTLVKGFNLLYPLVSRVFYKANELRTILNKISSMQNIEVMGKECVVKRLYHEKKTVVTYEQDTVE